EVTYHQPAQLSWQVTVADTGDRTMTGGRIRRVREYLDPDEPFYLTYGDGVADVDVPATIELHRRSGLLATMTVVRPSARFGTVAVEGDRGSGMVGERRAGGDHVGGG